MISILRLLISFSFLSLIMAWRTFMPKPKCCAENKDGSFLSNISYVTDMGSGVLPDKGYIATDAGKRMIFVLGARDDVENSLGGFYLRACNNASCPKAIFSVWDQKNCKTLKIPKICLLGARQCVGSHTVWPNFHSTTTIDPSLKLNSWRLMFKNVTLSSLYVNEKSCSPVNLVSAFGKKRKEMTSNNINNNHNQSLVDNLIDMFSTIMVNNLDYNPFMDSTDEIIHSAPSTLSSVQNSDTTTITMKPEDFNWISLLYHNSSATKPSSDYFAIPSWCKQAE